MGGVVIGVVLAVVGFIWIARLAARAHTVIEMADGAATLVRGTLPPGLLGDLQAIARDATGTVELRGGGASLKISSEGLSEGAEQRVRNVVLLMRDRIRP
ncbi:MAG: DUF3634 family protein [Proteobacteria bacterium]|nr:DUF3634 family protein [Pseudomonadota bacterium]